MTGIPLKLFKTQQKCCTFLIFNAASSRVANQETIIGLTDPLVIKNAILERLEPTH